MEKNLPKVLTIENADEEKFLRRKTPSFDFSSMSPKELSKLIQTMRRVMKASVGIGLSANQIGLNTRLFVAETPSDDNGRSHFFAIFNPEIVDKSKEKIFMSEGCLSVPRTYGEVERHKEIVLKGQDKNQKVITIKATGIIAHIFQHETDHLNGILFIDKARNIQHETEAPEI